MWPVVIQNVIEYPLTSPNEWLNTKTRKVEARLHPPQGGAKLFFSRLLPCWTELSILLIVFTAISWRLRPFQNVQAVSYLELERVVSLSFERIELNFFQHFTISKWAWSGNRSSSPVYVFEDRNAKTLKVEDKEGAIIAVQKGIGVPTGAASPSRSTPLRYARARLNGTVHSFRHMWNLSYLWKKKNFRLWCSL